MPAVDVPGCTKSLPRRLAAPSPVPLSYVMFPLSGAELFSLPLALRWNFLCLIAAQRQGLFAAAAGGTKTLPRLLFFQGGMNH